VTVAETLADGSFCPMATAHHASKIHRFRFTQDEDHILTDLVMRGGQKSWTWIASHLPGRNPRQCRDRWNHFLAPKLPAWALEARPQIPFPSRINGFGVTLAFPTDIPKRNVAPHGEALQRHAGTLSNLQFQAALEIGSESLKHSPREEESFQSPDIAEFFWGELDHQTWHPRDI
jgi:hypothetical protein